MDNSKAPNNPNLNLLELISIIIKWKFLIIAAVILAIIASIAFNKLTMKESFEARTVLMAQPINLEEATRDSDNNSLIDYLTSQPILNMQTYMEFVLSDEVLNSTIEKLDLRDDNNNLIPTGSLRGMVTANQIGNTNLIQIRAMHGDPKRAADIANTMAESFIESVTSSIRRLSNQMIGQILVQLNSEEQNLIEKSRIISDYLISNKNVDLMRAEVEMLKNKMTSTQSALLNLESEIATYTDMLNQLHGIIERSPDLDPADFFFEISLEEPSEMPSIKLDLAGDALSNTVLQLEIAKIQTQLIKNISQQSALTEQVADLSAMFTQRQIELTDAEFRFNALNRELRLAEEAYNAYQMKYKEAMLTVASDIGKNNVIVSLVANIPTTPVRTSEAMNVAFAVIVALVLSVFTALFIEYWRRNRPVNSKSSN